MHARVISILHYGVLRKMATHRRPISRGTIPSTKRNTSRDMNTHLAAAFRDLVLCPDATGPLDATRQAPTPLKYNGTITAAEKATYAQWFGRLPRQTDHDLDYLDPNLKL